MKERVGAGVVGTRRRGEMLGGMRSQVEETRERQTPRLIAHRDT